MNPQPAHLSLRRQGLLETLVRGLAHSVFALCVVTSILAGKNLPAQTDAPQTITPVQQQNAAARPAQPRRRDAHAHPASTQRPPALEAVPAWPPALPAPIWPANQPPNQARVSWDSRGLEIEAANSSLNQILHQVAAQTGAKLQGLGQDQRVFGSYGPGPKRNVLWKLLDGSGYNLLMGGRDDDPPLEIVLSARSPASPQTAIKENRSDSGDDKALEQFEPDLRSDYPPEQQRPQPIQNPFGNGDPPRDKIVDTANSR